MRFPPHRFYIQGKLWKTRFGDPEGELFKSRHQYAWCQRKERMILFHPLLRLKKNRGMLWTSFGHELLHAFDWRLSHKTIARLETPLGSLMGDNDFFLEAPDVKTRPARRRPASARRATPRQ